LPSARVNAFYGIFYGRARKFGKDEIGQLELKQIHAATVLNTQTKISTLPLFELAVVLVRPDHVVSFIVNANHGVV
jgi:hypothetical protein